MRRAPGEAVWGQRDRWLSNARQEVLFRTRLRGHPAQPSRVRSRCLLYKPQALVLAYSRPSSKTPPVPYGLQVGHELDS